VSRLLADSFMPSVLIEGDAFFAFVARGAIEPWLPEADQQNSVVTKAAAAAAGRFASGGFTTVYDGVLGPWFLKAFAAATGLDHFDYVVLLPTVERCVERVATRVDHGFTDEAATRHMHKQFIQAEIDDRHVLRDPPDNAETVADLIRAAVNSGTATHTAS
jgi:hypothetical protein